MGIAEKSIWILIRHYDHQGSNFENAGNSLQQVELPSILTFPQLKSTIYEWANVDVEDDSKVVKLRQYDNILIPYSFLLKGSLKEKPFIIDVVKVHQYCPANKRTLPPDYIYALKSKLTDLEKRVINIENSFPNLASVQFRAVEEKADELSSCISFLDRRLEELAPPIWKSQFAKSKEKKNKTVS